MKKYKLGEIIESVSVQDTLKKDYLYAVNTSDIYCGKILNPKYLPVKTLKGQFKKSFKKGDILFSEIRPKNKRFALVNIEDTTNYIASTKIMVLRKTTSDIDLLYLYYCLTDNAFLEKLQSRAENRICSFPQITFDILSEYSINVPDLKQQEKIANVLSTIDFKIENNNKIIQELENMAKDIYNYWFLQFDFPNEEGKPYKSSGGKMVWNDELKKEIPEGWEVKKIGDCIEHINTGLNPRQNFKLNNGDIKYVTVKNINNNGTLSFESCDTIDNDAKNTVHDRSQIEVGDILFASIAPLGRCYIIEEEPKTWDINESVFSIRPNYDIISSEYLYLYFMSGSFIKLAENSSTGSVFSGIRMDTLKNIDIILPNKKINIKFSDKINNLFSLKQNLVKENENLSSFRDFLLPLLMNGQVSIKD